MPALQAPNPSQSHFWKDHLENPLAIALHNIRLNLLTNTDPNPEDRFGRVLVEIARALMIISMKVDSKDADILRPFGLQNGFLEFPLVVWLKEDDTPLFPDELTTDWSEIKPFIDDLRNGNKAHKHKFPQRIGNSDGTFEIGPIPWSGDGRVTAVVLYRILPDKEGSGMKKNSLKNSDTPTQNNEHLKTVSEKVKDKLEDWILFALAHFNELQTAPPDPPKEGDRPRGGNHKELRRVLSELQNDCYALLSPSTDDIKQVFSVVFVLPRLTEDGTIYFRYMLTARQEDFLEELGRDTGKHKVIVDQIKMLQLDLEKAETKLKSQFRENYTSENPLITQLLSSRQTTDFSNIPRNRLEENLLKQLHETLNDPSHKNDPRRNLEALRKHLFGQYALQDKTKEAVINSFKNAGSNSSELLQGPQGRVNKENAFLITKIIKKNMPEVVEGVFVNHPEAREDYTIEKLVELLSHEGREWEKIERETDERKKNKDKQIFVDVHYPRALHLFEMIFFPNRLFMYPVYLHGSPLILSAFDADRFTGDKRQILGSIIDRHARGIFSSLVEYEVSNSAKAMVQWAGLLDPDEEHRLKYRLARLLLPFCTELRHFSFNANGDPLESEMIQSSLENAAQQNNASVTVSQGAIVFNIRNLNASIKFSFRGKPFLSKDKLDVLKMHLEHLASQYAQVTEISRSRRRFAISAVMARNMSHNIGSHVLADLIHENQINRIHGDVGESNILVNQCGTHQEPGSSPIITREEKFARFNNYLKSRMDFLADIATSTPTLQTNKWLYSDVLAGFHANRLMLDRISGVRDFKYEIDLLDCRTGAPAEVKHRETDILVAMPNDVLGCHALYTILENLIRNTAKHQQAKSARISIEVHECAQDNSLYELWIHDGIDIPGTAQLDAAQSMKWQTKCKDPRPEHQLVSSPSNIEWIVYQQNERLNSSILESGTLRMGGWGLIEMEVSAAYLRMLPVEVIDATKYLVSQCHDNCSGLNGEVNLLKAIPAGTKRLSLSYLFHIKKPSNYLIVSNPISGALDQSKTRGLINVGVDIIPIQSFKPNETVYPHQFFLYQGVEIPPMIHAHGSALPSRLLCVDNKLGELLKTRLESDNPASDKLAFLDDKIWPAWTSTLLARDDIKSVYCRNTMQAHSTGTISFVASNECSGKLLAIFLDHGGDWNEAKSLCEYLEPLDSRSERTLPNFGSSRLVWKQSDVERYKLAILAESVFLRVGIVDERIQQATTLEYKPKGHPPISFEDIYAKTRIFVPLNCDLSGIDFGSKEKEKEKTTLEILEEWFQKTVPSLDALIIHLGVLERALKAISIHDPSKREIEKYLKEKVLRFSNQQIGIVCIICSGRGQPHNLPEDCPFVSLSAVQDCLVSDRSKYKLAHLVFSARKLRRI